MRERTRDGLWALALCVSIGVWGYGIVEAFGAPWALVIFGAAGGAVALLGLIGSQQRRTGP